MWGRGTTGNHFPRNREKNEGSDGGKQNGNKKETDRERDTLPFAD